MKLQKTKITVMCILTLVTSFCLTSVISGLNDGTEENNFNDAVPTVISELPEKAAEYPEYTVGERDGFAVVFSGEENTVVLETDIRIAGLREVDREMLKNGIAVNSYEDVLKLLEDLNS